jgi:putative two-component system response regulator
VICAENSNIKAFLTLIRYRILVVDSDLTNRTLIEAILRSQPDFDVHCVAHAGATLDYLQKNLVDAVLIDTTLPDADGYALCSHIKLDLGLTQLPIVLFANFVTPSDRTKAMESGAEDIVTKPFQRSDLMLRMRNLLKLKSLQDQVTEVEHIMYALSSLIEARDNYTYGHAERVAGLMEKLGRAAGLAEEEMQMLRRAAFLKDIGKAGIPDDVLNSPSAWTRHEREVMTERLIMPSQEGRSAVLTPRLLPIIRHCHEFYDGTGYPDQLIGDQIPMGSRLLSIADAYDAMISDRPFRSALSEVEAVAILQAGSGKQWDPALIQLFVECLIQQNPVIAMQEQFPLRAA